MGRIHSRYTLRGVLVADSAVHVGGYGPDATADLTQVRDGLDRVVLPGTSLAGVIRAALHQQGSEQRWWGTHLDDDPRREAETRASETTADEARASLITVSDAPATGPVSLEIRDGVGIDRVTGAAAQQHLYTRQVVPAGTGFSFELAVEAPDADSDDPARDQVCRVAALLTDGITVGAAGTRGRGRLRLTESTLRREDFTSPQGLFAALGTGGEPVDFTAVPSPAALLRITVPWRPLGPVLSHVADAAGNADAFPAVCGDSGGIRLLIPGSSVKGVLRSHAERIVRTVLDTPAPPPGFLAQLEAASDLPGIGELFGAAGDLAAERPGRRGLVSVHDLTSRANLPRREWNRVRSVTAGDREQQRPAFARAVDALNAKTTPHGLWFDIATRNAIDRWTGAAADGALFTALEPYAIGPDPTTVWTPLRLELDIGRARRAGTAGVGLDALLGLLLLLLRDFADGWIPIGFGTTRGSGAVRADLDAITVTFHGPTSPADNAAALHGKTLREIFDDPAIIGPIDTAWQRAVSAPDEEAVP